MDMRQTPGSTDNANILRGVEEEDDPSSIIIICLKGINRREMKSCRFEDGPLIRDRRRTVLQLTEGISRWTFHRQEEVEKGQEMSGD